MHKSLQHALLQTFGLGSGRQGNKMIDLFEADARSNIGLEIE